MKAQRAGVLRANIYRLANCRNIIPSVLCRLGALHADAGLSFCRPGLRYGASPVRLESPDRRSVLDRLLARGLSLASRSQYTEQRSSGWLDSLSQRIIMLKALTPIQCKANRAELLWQMRHEKMTEDALDGALGHACIAAENVMGWVPRANQRLAARAMLRGHCVEMATGEGKTLSIALAAAATALSGTPVHVLTANDYLAARDADTLKRLYQFLGLRVSSVMSNSQVADRRQAYAADIVYVTAKQIASDWLSDVLELGTRPDSVAARLTALTRTASDKAYTPVLRGLCLAIVDEADSLFVDEARIPLVLAMSQAYVSDVDT
ncbi:MAG: DEAD/DEAH box helicase [Granulosicoccus sp.]